MADLAGTLTPTDEDRLEQAEALVRAYCGWHIAPSREDTVTIRVLGGERVFLPSMHVTAVDSVSEAGVALTVDTEYTWDTPSGVLRRTYWAYDELVEVAFTHGYEDVPADVTAVVQAVAQRAVDNPGSLVRSQAGPFSETYSATSSGQVATLSLLESEKAALAPYKVPGLA